MAKKKKAKTRIQHDLEGLEAGLFALGNLEKDLNVVRLHLRKFLTRAQKLESGDPHEFPGSLVPRRRKRRA